jgi:pimeloyl-ACP methyl ester carboxylesterase
MSITSGLGAERLVELSAGTMAVREAGAGPPVVFLHGILTNGDLWRSVAPALQDRHRCVVPDLPLGSHRHPLWPGADRTPPGIATLVGELLEALDLRDVTLVGNDTGGALAQLLVTTRPERVARLVLTNCDAFANFLPALFKPFQLVGGSVPGGAWAILQAMRSRTLQRLPIAFGRLAKRPIPAAVARSYLGPALDEPAIRGDLRAVLRGIDSRYTQEAARRLAGFDRPVLLAWAREDRVFPFRYAEELSHVLVDARVGEIEDSYALVPEDNPRRLVELLREFVPAVSEAAPPPAPATDRSSGSLRAGT